MNIGNLTATLGFDTTSAMKSMTSFERMMFTVVNNIDNQLEKMASAFTQVGGSAIAMGNSSSVGMNKIVVASKMAKVEVAQLTSQIQAADAAAKIANTSVGAGNIAGHISGVVAKNRTVGAMASTNKVPDKVMNEAIGEAIADAKLTQMRIANRIKEANSYADSAYKKIKEDKKVQMAAIADDKQRTAMILANRIKEANAYADSAYKKIQADKKVQMAAIMEDRKRTEQFNKIHEKALLENRKKTITLDDKPAINSLSNIQSKLAGLNSMFQRSGYLMTSTFTLPIVLAGRATFQLVKDYEYSIQKIVGLTGVAQSAVNDWSKEIMKIGPELGKTPQELADALYFISSSGIKGAEAMDVLELSAKAASSGLGETKAVADYLTSALNAYRGTGLTAAYATDVLVAAVREGKAEAEGFASAMGQLIPIASNLGVSIDQVAGAMAAITLTGSTAAQAAVYLKGVFNTLIKANEQGKGPLESLGLSYNALAQMLKKPGGVIKVMEEFRRVQMKLGNEAIKDVIPDIRALQGFMSIAGKNFKYNSEMMERVTNSAGSLGAAWAAVSNTIKIKFDRAISQANVSMITLGQSLAKGFLPLLQKAVVRLEQFTKWFDNLTDAQKNSRLGFLAFMAVIGPASLLLSGFVWIIRGVIGAIQGVGIALKFLQTMWLTNPFTPFIIAITGLLFILPEIKKFFQEVADGKTQLDQVLGSKEDNDVLTSMIKDIEGKMQLLDKMDKSQTEKLQNNIGTVIQLYRDKRVELLEIKKKGLEDDLFIITQEKKLQELSLSYVRNQQKYKAANPKSINAQHALAWMEAFQRSIDGVNKSLADYSAGIKSAFDKQTKYIDDEIIKYEKLEAEVKKTMDVIAAYAEAVANDIAAQDALDKISVDLQKELKYIERLASVMKTLGIEYDAVGAKADAFLGAINKLTEQGLTEQSRAVQSIVEQYKKLRVEITAIPITKIDTSQISTPFLGTDPNKLRPNAKLITKEDITFMKNFQVELDLIALKSKTLGSQFDVSRNQLAYFKDTLNKMWDEGKMRPGDPLMDEMVKNMQKLTTATQWADIAIGTLSNAFSSLFDSILDGGKGMADALVNIIKSMASQIAAELIRTAITKAINGIVTSGEGITQTVKSMSNLVTAITAVSAAEQTAAAAATTTSVMNTAASTANTAAKSGEAIAGATASGAKMPFPYNLIAIAVGVAAVIAALSQIGKARKMANGGVVPGGFPGDTYPALLSSGETVLPKRLSGMAMQGSMQFAPVELVIKENSLVGILKKANTRKSLY